MSSKCWSKNWRALTSERITYNLSTIRSGDGPSESLPRCMSSWVAWQSKLKIDLSLSFSVRSLLWRDLSWALLSRDVNRMRRILSVIRSTWTTSRVRTTWPKTFASCPWALEFQLTTLPSTPQSSTRAGWVATLPAMSKTRSIIRRLCIKWWTKGQTLKRNVRRLTAKPGKPLNALLNFSKSLNDFCCYNWPIV